MKSNTNWIAAAAAALIAAAAPALADAADAARCDAAALTCFANGAAAPAGEASFTDLVRSQDTRAMDYAGAPQALAHPAAYAPSLGLAPTENEPPAMAPAGMGAIDSAIGMEIANPGVPAWLALPRSLAAPDSSIAWVFGIGFLGFVILRRVRAAPDY